MSEEMKPYGGIDIFYNDDGTVTEERFGTQRPRELSPAELRPFIEWARYRQDRLSAEPMSAEQYCTSA